MIHINSLYSKPGDYIAAKAMDTGAIVIDYDRVSKWAEYKNDISIMEAIQLTNLETVFQKKSKIRPTELSVHSLIWLMRKAILSRLTYVITDDSFKSMLFSKQDDSDLHAPILRILTEKKDKYSHYNNLLDLMMTYIPSNTNFIAKGINHNMITAYFPASNELIFAFRGTDIGTGNEQFMDANISQNIPVNFTDNPSMSAKCISIANGLTNVYFIKKNTNKPLSIQTTGHSFGGAIALKTAIAIRGYCVGFNVGGRGYCLNPSKKSLEENFIHIHNPKDTFSNDFIRESSNNRLLKILSYCFPVKSPTSRTTVILDQTKIQRQYKINSKGTLFQYHNLDNAILEIEEAIIQKIFTEQQLTENMMIKQKINSKDKKSATLEKNPIDYTRVCMV